MATKMEERQDLDRHNTLTAVDTLAKHKFE